MPEANEKIPNQDVILKNQTLFLAPMPLFSPATGLRSITHLVAFVGVTSRAVHTLKRGAQNGDEGLVRFPEQGMLQHKPWRVFQGAILLLLRMLRKGRKKRLQPFHAGISSTLHSGVNSVKHLCNRGLSKAGCAKQFQITVSSETMTLQVLELIFIAIKQLI